MKFITIGFMLWGNLLCGQTVIAPVVEGGASVPAPPCVTGQVYFNTGAAAGQNLYVCASNTWTQINGAAANGVSTNTSNTYAAGTVQSFLGTLDASGAAATLPAQTGATLPATCSMGQLFLNTGADPSRTLYICSATNTWSQGAYAQGATAQMPASCVVGQMYFATDATPAGQNLYLCAAADTWTRAGLAGSGAANQMAFFSGTNTVASDNKITRDANGDLSVTGMVMGGVVSAGGPASLYSYSIEGGWAVRASSLDGVTCSAGAASLNGYISIHKVNLNNQTSCAISIGTGGLAYSGVMGVVMLCNGATTPTSTIVWTGVKGGMAAGGTTSQCAAQTVYYDSTNSVWYATSPGTTWN